ncbi:2'-5' RNA ligase family protein [Sinomonas flava]|uniref:2'-5' RNA ligase family protein n=1 Tax=Sinomonas flava TaxID=496857 RepID=UPI0039A52437
MTGAAAGGLHPFVAVAFVEPAPVGERFGKRHWPLHVTLLRFDMAPDAAREAVSGAVGVFEPPRVTVGHDADFGYRGRVRVSLVEPDTALQSLHDRIRVAVAAAGGRIHSPQHTGGGFRPHITVQGSRRVARGDRLVLTSVSLVDMAPAGDSEWRLPVAEWAAASGRDTSG